MAVKVAINGFGRIGRLAFRQMFGHEGSEIVAINDLTSPDMLAYLLKYDTTQGNYARDHEVVAGEDSITVDGKKITIYKEADASKLPWGELGVDVVLECTGFYTSKAKAQAVHRLLHLQGQGPGPHRRRRQEGRHLRSRGQRPPHDRLQRQPRAADRR